MQGSYGASLVVRAIGTWAILDAIAIVIGGSARWGNPAYDVVNLMPGSPFTWAIFLFVGGMLAMIGSLAQSPIIGKDVTIEVASIKVRNVGLKVIAVWFFLIGIASVVTIFQLSDISFGFGSTELLLAVICVVMTKVKEPQHVSSA
jgi:hypothetical protein